MKFSKKVLSLLFVLVCTIALVGCGSSSTTTTTTKTTTPSVVDPVEPTNPSCPASVYITVQDESGNALSGAKIHYTNPNGVESLSAASDIKGKITIVIDLVGTYKMGDFEYNGKTYTGMYLDQEYNTDNDYYLTYRLKSNGKVGMPDSHPVAR